MTIRNAATLLSAALGLALLPTACQTASVNGTVQLIPLAEQIAPPASVFGAGPKITRTIPQDGLARLNANITVRDAAVTALGNPFKLLALPGTWSNCITTIWSPTANGAFSQVSNKATIPFTSFVLGAGPSYSATATFLPLRPATDYQGQAFLQNAGGTIVTTRLSGSSAGTYTLNAGANTLNYAITVNGNEATYSVVSSANNNVVTGNSIVKSDQVVLNTGIAANLGGVAEVDVFISGVAYGSPGAPVQIAKLTTAASWNSYTWNTSVDNTVAPCNYVAATLVGGALQATTAGQLDFQAVDANGILIGKASMAIAVFGLPAITIKVQ